MEKINFLDEVMKRKDSFLEDLTGLLKIRSVLDEKNTTDDAPLGQGVKDALDYMLKLGERDGFTAKNVGNLAGHLEMGSGEELVGMLGHVDVVPEGDGWSVDPYGATVKDGKIYARGTSDDKGPTIAAYYAMKIVKELGLSIDKRVRLIIGTDEESDWRCMDHYFANEEMPTTGFVPDADFPIIHAEKGITDFDMMLPAGKKDNTDSTQLTYFQSGLRYNMVPDHAKAYVKITKNPDELTDKFRAFIKENSLEGGTLVDEGEMTFRIVGKSAHGAEPREGKNAGIYLAQFLNTLDLDETGKTFIQTVSDFHEHSRGESLDMVLHDDVSGDLTVNVGVMEYTQENGGKIGLNMRYPVTINFDEHKEKLMTTIKEKGFAMENFSDSKPTYVKKDDPLVQTLKHVYEEQTGDKGEPIAIGGGTYARALDHGVAFGAMFPGREDVMHQKDEYAIIEDLLKTTAIYTQAIYELAKK